MLKNITAKMYKLNKMLEQEVKTLSNNKDISKKDPKSLLMSVLFHDDHIHHIIPGDEEDKEKILQAIYDRYNELIKSKEEPRQTPSIQIVRPDKPNRTPDNPRKIVFGHHRALGDGLMFTSGIRDFKLLFPDILINVDSNQKMLWENNPYIDTSLKKDDEDVEYYKVGYPMIGNINNSNMHFTSMFLFDMIAIADFHEPLPLSIGEFTAIFANGRIGDPALGDTKKNAENAREPFISFREKYHQICKEFSRQRGDIHLTDKEKEYNLIKDIYGIEKYWVIGPGGKRDCTCKIWDWRNFQEVIDYFEGKIKFVVIGRSDHLIEKLNNVIDLTDKFNKDVRALVPLIYHSEGCVSGPSFLMHLAAAMPPKYRKARKPCVAIFGGREPHMWSGYTNHQILHSNGIYTCCDAGGCWKARVTPLQKDPKHNKNLCSHPVKVDDKGIAECMDNITVQDVIRAIEKYYDGDIYKYENQGTTTTYTPVVKDTLTEGNMMGGNGVLCSNNETKKPIKNPPSPIEKFPSPFKTMEDLYIPNSGKKEINLVGNLNSKGGGEQSFAMIATLLRKSGWKVNLYPWSSVHENYKDIEVEPYSYKDGTMLENMKEGLPLLFYANDCVWDFAKTAEPVVSKSSSVMIGINFANGSLTKCNWLSKSGKLRAVIFQNTEKKDEWIRDAIGFDSTQLIVMFGAINLDKFLDVAPQKRENKQDLMIIKTCLPDYRKYVTMETEGGGDKQHIWQHNIIKENDIKFYTRLLKDTKKTKFAFMVAHKELVKAFEKEPRMIFYKWNEMDVGDFLKQGHIFLYRTSNHWRDQYPRVMAEALAAGIPCLGEPRDGTKDRIVPGDTGFHCVDYDGFLYAIKLLQRKENYRHKMGMYAKEWAKKNLDPRKWIEVIEQLVL